MIFFCADGLVYFLFIIRETSSEDGNGCRDPQSAIIWREVLNEISLSNPSLQSPGNSHGRGNRKIGRRRGDGDQESKGL